MKTTLAALCLCAAPLLAQAQAQNCSSPNTDAEYILGTVEGEDSAMHWSTGLVWKRCSEGQSFSGGRCTGAASLGTWNHWADGKRWLPRSFAGQSYWDITIVGPSQDLLASGAWRMAYRNELLGITSNCGNNPKVNRTVFPDTPSSHVWSASPTDSPELAWSVIFFSGSTDYYVNIGNQARMRLVRGGQPFADLAAPAAQGAPAGAQAAFPAFTLAPVTGAGEAWGGARIEGGGSPQFQVNGGAWVQEAIVKSGDQITVRMTATAAGADASTATFTLRSGRTSGTAAYSSNGSEATARMETSAQFTLEVSQDGACGAAAQQPAAMAPSANLCATGTPGGVLSAGGQHTWECAGERGGGARQCSAPWASAGRGTGTVRVDGAGGWRVASAAFDAAAVPALPPGARSVHAPLALVLEGGSGSARVTVTYTEPAPQGAIYLKYGPSRDGLNCAGADCAQPHWYALPGAAFSADRTQVTLELTDGGDGDADGTADGRITDPGLPALLAAPAVAQAIPTLSGWALALMAALAGLLVRRRLPSY